MIYELIKNFTVTQSPFGQQALHNIKPFKRGEIDALQKEFDDIEIAITWLTNYPALMEKLRFDLGHIKDIKGSIGLLARKQSLTDIDCFEIKVFLLYVEKIAAGYSQCMPVMEDFSLKSIDPVLDILDPLGQKIPTFHISSHYSNKLGDIRAEKKALEAKIRHATKTEREMLLNKRILLVAAEEKEIAIVLKDISREIYPFVEAFKQNFKALERLDLLLGKARFSMAEGGSKPSFQESGLSVQKALHPPLIHLLEKKGRKFTPITMELPQGVTIITGANMGGKSIALQTVFIQVELFRHGFYPLASRFSMCFLDHAYLLQEDTSSLTSGLSSFAADINDFNDAIKDIENHSCFLAMDEFARGTNPDEGAKIVRAVSSFLHEQNAISLLATHYENIPTGDMGHYQVTGLKNIDFSTIQTLDTLYEHMDYSLIPVEINAPVPKDALNICKLLHMKPDILERLEKSYE